MGAKGTILILVMALLALLALLGTTFLSVMRVDRQSAHQHQANTQVDLLVEGVKQMLIARVAEMPADYRDGFHLAARQPQVLGEGRIGWPTISMPLSVGRTAMADPVTGVQFVNPYGLSHAMGAQRFSAAGKDAYYFEPTCLDQMARGVSQRFPALTLRNRNGEAVGYDGAAGGAVTLYAVDTDGDGIGDAGLWKIPGAMFDGVEYYAAMRLIDHNSALNVNTAWCRTDFNASHAPLRPANMGLFLSNVGLNELLDTYTTSAAVTAGNQGAESVGLISYRWGGDSQGGVIGSGSSPVDDAGALRNDFVFVSQGDAQSAQVGMRVDNPGRNRIGAGTVRYQSFPLADQLALTYPFAIRNSSTTLSMLEMTLMPSLYGTTKAYDASATEFVQQWYDDNFAWGDRAGGPSAPGKSRRSYFVARNPVSNAVVPPRMMELPPAMPAWPVHPVKASANTAPFAELWRAYWAAMANPANGAEPLAPAAAMFQSPLRGGGTLGRTETMMLRAALAAANTIALREGNDDVQRDQVPAYVVPLNAQGSYYAVVYGLKRQPFISECVIQRQGAGGDFIALEIYNPNPDPTGLAGSLPLDHYCLAVLDRSGGAPVIVRTFAFPAAVGSIPGDGRIVVYGGTAPGNVAIPAGRSATIAGLTSAIGREVVLMRTRSSSGPSRSAPPNGQGLMGPATRHQAFDEAFVVDWAPLDQLDLRQAVAPGTIQRVARYRYVRPSNLMYDWRSAYGGMYTRGAGHHLHAVVGQANVDGLGATAATLGSADSVALPAIDGFSDGGSHAIEVNAFGSAGPHPWRGGSAIRRFPFGGFARNGDLLQVLYIGSYKILDAAGTLVELNGVTVDAALAADASAGPNQQVGRFWPNGAASYEWCGRLFDCVTVQSPQDDYLPNIAPATVNSDGMGHVLAPQGVANGPVMLSAQANRGNEWMAGVNGLVNINTASWKVLSMLPLVMNASGQVDVSATESLARKIVEDREANGPYRTLFDLNRLEAFRTGGSSTLPPYDDEYGELMPTGGNALFRREAMQLTRLSNLMTTRSDTFTCYLVIQGWRNAGTPGATLAVERRLCFIVDRSADLRNPRLIPVPMPR